MTTREQSYWIRRMSAVAHPRRKIDDPVGWVDAQTSMHDLRAALCVASGVPLGAVRPASGHDMRGVA